MRNIFAWEDCKWCKNEDGEFVCDCQEDKWVDDELPFGSDDYANCVADAIMECQYYEKE